MFQATGSSKLQDIPEPPGTSCRLKCSFSSLIEKMGQAFLLARSVYRSQHTSHAAPTSPAFFQTTQVEGGWRLLLAQEMDLARSAPCAPFLQSP